MFTLLTLTSAALLQGAIAPAVSQHCRSGPPEPVPHFFDAVRPTPTALCDYGLDEVRRRIGRLFIPSKSSKLRVEEIERLFDLPEMTTAYDDPREAEFMMKVSGLGGWKLTVHVREGFFPTNHGPPRFVPGPRPGRLDRFENAVSLVSFDLSSPRQDSEKPICPIDPFVAAALSSGWIDITNTVIVTDGGIPSPTFKGPDSVTVMIEQSSTVPCSSRLMFDREVPSGRNN